MAHEPTLVGDTIYRGAAHIIIDKPVAKADWKYIFAKGEVEIAHFRPEEEMLVNGFGLVASPSKDEYFTITFTPADTMLNAASLAFLYGSALSAAPGASWFGSSSTAVHVHTQSGRILGFTNCKPTSLPALIFGGGRARFGGSVTLTAILGRGLVRTAADALFTPWADETFEVEPNDDEFRCFTVAGSWAAISGTDIDTMDGWTLTPNPDLQPFATANMGTIDYFVGQNASLEVSARPANIAESDLWGNQVLGTSRAIGTKIPGALLTLTEDYPGLTATVNNARLIQPKNSFSVQNPIAGQCVWRARRSVSDGSWLPLGTLALTANPET